MLEKTIEKKLTQEIKKINGLCLKFISPGFNGVPDRLILLSGGVCFFVETKAPGKKPRPIQVKRKRQLEKLGFKVYIIDSVEQIGGIIDEIHTT